MLEGYCRDVMVNVCIGLHVIREHDLVHGHLHGGNVLVEDEMDSIDTKITDTGLHGPTDNRHRLDKFT